MTLEMKIARVLDPQDLPHEDEYSEWVREIEPWSNRLSDLYNFYKNKHDFQTSARMARGQVVLEMLKLQSPSSEIGADVL